MRKRLIVFLSVPFLMFSSILYAEVNLKIAYVSMMKAVSESNDGIKYKKFLEAQVAQSRKALEAKEQEILGKEEELKNNIMLNEASKKQKEIEISQMKRSLMEEAKKLEASFRQDEIQHRGKSFQSLAMIIKKIAEKEKFDIVMELGLRQTILYTKYEITDITDMVISEYNKEQAVKQ
ncbi:OmpH family outer membrane protein [bacterium]|nr:OmpH family outer membrane protein [bacterium]